MQQLDDIFTVIFEVHKEYNSILRSDAQETDEEWFDDVELKLFAFKQKIHNWMKDAEAEKKAAGISRVSNVSAGRRPSSVRSTRKYSIKIKQQTVNKLKQQIFKRRQST